MLEPVVARYRKKKLRRYFRADAAFAKPEIYEFLEAEGYGYAIRLPANPILQGHITHLLTRPAERVVEFCNHCDTRAQYPIAWQAYSALFVDSRSISFALSDG